MTDLTSGRTSVNALARFSVLFCLIGCVAAGLEGCAQFPEGGPNAKTVVGHAKPGTTQMYGFVPVTPNVLTTLSSVPRNKLASIFTDGAPAPVAPIGIGDLVSVTIWDFGGLLGAVPGQTASAPPTSSTPGGPQPLPVAATSTLPAQAVDQQGNISIPYAGVVHAAGLSTTALQQAIALSLKPVMIHPQVVVIDTMNQSNFVTVSGDAAHPGRIALTPAGIRLLDAIALSGGSTWPTSDLTVRLTRRGITRSTRLEEVVKDPNENVFLNTDDLVYLDRAPQSVVVLGAANHAGQVAFNKERLTLAEAIGNGGGLTDIQADPFGVFVFRFENDSTVRALGLADLPQQHVAGLAPVVYQINLKKPEGFLMLQTFEMQDHDLVYIANADTVQIAKIFRFFLGISSIAGSVRTSTITSN